MNTCPILIGYRDRDFQIYRLNSVRFLFVGLDEERSLKTKVGYTRRIARSLARSVAFRMLLRA